MRITDNKVLVDEETQRRAIQQVLELFIKPEIKRRQDAGELEKPFQLQRAQVIFYPDARRPEVRLNEEVRTVVEVRIASESRDQIEKGAPVFLHQIESVKAIKLTEEEDPNVGHATLLLLGGSWLLHVDFIYNKERARLLLLKARQFLDSAQNAIRSDHWAVVVEALCTASELTAKAFLLTALDKKTLKSKTHGVIASQTNLHRNLGNLESKHVDVFNKVWGLRHSARYLEDEFFLTPEEARDFIYHLEEFVAFVGMRVDLKFD